MSKSAIGTVMGGHYQLALLVLAAAALFLLIAACGGDSGTVVESGGEPAATAAVGESPATEAAAAPSSGTQAPGTQSSDQQAADTPAPGAPVTQATDTPAPGAPASGTDTPAPLPGGHADSGRRGLGHRAVADRTSGQRASPAALYWRGPTHSSGGGADVGARSHATADAYICAGCRWRCRQPSPGIFRDHRLDQQ